MARRPGLATGEGVSWRYSIAAAAQRADTRDDDHVVWLAPGAHPLIDAMQSPLGAVGDLQDVVGLAKLSVL